MKTIKFAIDLETSAAKYYQDQATIFKDYPVTQVFEMLSKNALQYIKLLQYYDKQLDVEPELPDSTELNNFYENLENFKCDYSLIPKQLNAYQKALELERKSIQLYSDFLKKTTDEEGRKLLEFLIKQEKEHYAFIEELVRLLRRPDNWVEDAEFGRREDY